MKKLCFFTLSLIILFNLTACTTRNENNQTTVSEITVTAGDKEIYAVVKSTELFQSIINDPDLTIPYLEIGEKIQIELKDKTPITYELMDYILTDDGALKYNMPMIKTTDIEFINGLGSFILKENISAMLSSDSKDYEPGATIRGFHLICSSVTQKKEYIFIVRTDAT